MTVTDSLRILGLPRNACLNDLKVAYRSKAKKYHPDRKGGDCMQFNRLHEAYSFLLDYGLFQPASSGVQGEKFRREAEERVRREEFRKAAEERIRREAAREKKRKEAEAKAARELKRREMEKKAAERRAAYEEKCRREQLKAAKERAKEIERKKKSPSHRVFTAGSILNGNGTDRQKLQAINTLISLKRKSAYPFLKKALYEGSEKVQLASIEAIGKLKIIQAGPELASLMCSGSVKIRMTVLNSINEVCRRNLYSDIINIARKDKDISIRQKAEVLHKRIYG